MNKETVVNCHTHIPLESEWYSTDTRRPNMTFPTAKDEYGEEYDSEIVIQNFGIDETRRIITGNNFPNGEVAFSRWLDKDGELKHWHMTQEPSVDEKSRHFITGVLKNKERGEVRDFLECLPQLRICPDAGISLALPDADFNIDNEKSAEYIHYNKPDDNLSDMFENGVTKFTDDPCYDKFFFHTPLSDLIPDDSTTEDFHLVTGLWIVRQDYGIIMNRMHELIQSGGQTDQRGRSLVSLSCIIISNKDGGAILG